MNKIINPPINQITIGLTHLKVILINHISGEQMDRSDDLHQRLACGVPHLKVKPLKSTVTCQLH